MSFLLKLIIKKLLLIYNYQLQILNLSFIINLKKLLEF